MRGSTCAHPTLPGCTAKAQSCECESTRYTRKVFDWQTESLYHLNDSVVWTHKSCACNELIALQQRHQVDDGTRPDASCTSRLVKALKPYRKVVKPISYEAVIAKYTGGKRAIAQRAYDSLQVDPLDVRKDSEVRMFLKDDKYHTSKINIPRCIQYRSKRYGITAARFYSALEHGMLQITNTCRGVSTDNRVFAKGRNLTQRGADLRAIWDSFDTPVALSIDHSKFDAHCNVALLKAINKHNSHCLPKYCRRQFMKLARAQLVNRGKTANGTKFVTVGTRMSGDQNTGSDNSGINCGMLLDWLRVIGASGQLYIDGDDSVVIIESTDLHKVDMSLFKIYGMSTKLEKVSSVFEEIDFCQCRPVFDGVAWRMVRDPYRVLARIPWIVKKQPASRDAQWLKSVGMCELSLNMGLPVMQAVAERLIELSPKKYIATPLHYTASNEYIKPWRAEPRPITAEARASYERAWGISPQEQREYEKLTIGAVTTNIVGIFESWGGERPCA